MSIASLALTIFHQLLEIPTAREWSGRIYTNCSTDRIGREKLASRAYNARGGGGRITLAVEVQFNIFWWRSTYTAESSVVLLRVCFYIYFLFRFDCGWECLAMCDLNQNTRSNAIT